MRKWLLLALLLCTVAAPADAQRWFSTPDSARLVTSDVKLFLRLLDTLGTARTRRDSAALVFEQYFLPGSVGLKDFVRVRLGSVFNVLEALKTQPQYFSHLRTSLRELDQKLAAIPRHFATFERLYPDAIFSDTYFFVGTATTGGTIQRYKLLIGAEMFGRDAAAPIGELTPWQKDVLRDLREIDVIVVHELIHVNQWVGGHGLLRQVLLEGAADYLSEVITGRNVNAEVHGWANAREPQLWKEFQEDLKTGDMTRWLYNGGNPARGDRPPDLGYWIGYRIVKSYYERTTDKAAAIREILNSRNPEEFLKKSGYNPTS